MRSVRVSCAAGRLARDRNAHCLCPLDKRKEQPMLDVILLAVGLGFLAASIAYVYGCERL
ncbi:MAG: hypothetical protein J2P50_16675 [Hyphomicrobiaceae bacterium]|nr:hypothetical protein [Hyphomicrobiaceae bacterium]